MTDFNKLSYERHEKEYLDYASGGKKEKHAKTWFEEDTIDAWRFTRIHRLIDPLLEAYPDANWLTVGDGRYGKDAHYIEERGVKVLAGMLNITGSTNHIIGSRLPQDEAICIRMYSCV